MKGIKCCGECAYYDMEKHRCTRGAKNPGKATDSFYADCPLDDAKPVQNGYWYIERKNAMSYGCTKCSNCHVAAALRGSVIAPNEYYCKNCGSKNSDENGQLLFGE